MAFFYERDTNAGLTVHLHLSQRDIKLALGGALRVQHENDQAEQDGAISEVVLHVADI